MTEPHPDSLMDNQPQAPPPQDDAPLGLPGQEVDMSQVNYLMDEVLQLRDQKATLNADLKELNTTLTEKEARLCGLLQDGGIQSLNRNGWVLYLSRDMKVRASGGDREALVKTLMDNYDVMGHVLNFNSNSMKAYLKELMFNDHAGEWQVSPEKLPEDLRESVEFDEYYRLGVRRGSK